jgi:CheY-like chemotaxis protein
VLVACVTSTGALSTAFDGDGIVTLNFDDASCMPLMYGDEGKVSQILRNFLSNALKFTERGEIHVSAALRATEEGERALLCVRDTGIGIAAADHERIFEEFTQVDGPLQDRVRGTGLGLPLCRKLAHLLGGEVWVESEPGAGSCFYLSLPLRYAGQGGEEPVIEEAAAAAAPRRQLLALLIEDRPDDRAVIEACLRKTPFDLISTDRVHRARELLAAKEPDVVLLDIALRGEDTWRFLPEIKRAGIPVVVVSTANERAKGRALGADAWGVKPIHREWLLETLRHVILQSRTKRVLLVDDDVSPRTLLKVMLAPHCESIMEAADGRQALELFEREGADLVITDLVMPLMDGFELIERLRALPAGALVPIVVCTSHDPTPAQREALLALEAMLLSKSDLSRDAVFDTALNALALRAVRNPEGAPALDAEASQ